MGETLNEEAVCLSEKHLASTYLVEEGVLPEPEHHHVRSVSGTEGSEKVL